MSRADVRRPTFEDLEASLGVVRAVDEVELGEEDYTLEDLRSEWTSPRFDLATDAWLAEVDGAAVGLASAWLAVPRERAIVDVYVLPEHAADVEPELIQLVVARAAELAETEGTELLVHAPNISTNVARGERFAVHGFSVVRQFHRMTTVFTTHPQAPVLPPGVTVEAVGVAGAELAHGILVEAFRDHWGSGIDPWDEWREAHLEHAEFDPDLLLVAYVEGEPAAALLGWPHPSGQGKVPELGVLAAYRRRGLGELLLRESFVRFAARGWSGAQLGVDSQSLTGAPRLYARVGMTVGHTIDLWERRMGPPA